MSVTPYCTQFELDRIWSEFGVMARTDGNRDGESDAHGVTAVIEEATAKVNSFLLHRYSVATCAASAWVRWATAHIAACILARRFGLPAPEGIVADCDEYLDTLKAIKNGQEQLIADDGLATPLHDSRPAVANFTVDGRFNRSKVRTVRAISSDMEPNDVTKTKPALDYFNSGFSQ